MNDSPVVDEDVLTAVCAAFQLGAIVEPSAYVAQGVQGEVFKVSTSAGHWAVKKLSAQPDRTHLETQIRLQEAAGRAGVVSPRTRRTDGGEAAVTVDGAPWLASEWTDVRRTSGTSPRKAD